MTLRSDSEPDPGSGSPGQPPEAAETLRCMELRGGNVAVRTRVDLPGLDAWLDSLPHEGAERGGDVHYVSLCGGGYITRAIVADVAGHGESVGALAGALRTLMRRFINVKDQTALVRELNRTFGAVSDQGRFATAVVLTYLARSRRLTVCNAGHPRPLWYRAADRAWSLLDADLTGVGDLVNLPLGIDDDGRFEQFAVTLGPGDVVAVYTDALIEAIGGDGRQLGESGLLALAAACPVDDPDRFGPALLDAVAAHRGGAPADDDTTLLALHHDGSGRRRPGLREALDVYAKLFRLRPV